MLLAELRATRSDQKKKKMYQENIALFESLFTKAFFQKKSITTHQKYNATGTFSLLINLKIYYLKLVSIFFKLSLYAHVYNRIIFFF